MPNLPRRFGVPTASAASAWGATRSLLRCAALTAALGAAPAIASASGSAGLMPHRAIYEMTLDKNASGGGISNIVGRMVFEISGSKCEGFTQKMRMVTRVTPEKGSPRTTDIRTSSWEDGTATNFRFSSQQYMNSRLSEKASGTAKRGAPDGIAIALDEPKRKEMKIDGSVMFPAQHSIAILDAANAGKRNVFTRVYDGSEQGSKAYDTNTFIGKIKSATPDKMTSTAPGTDKLKGRKYWPLIMSFYEVGSDKNDGPPVYEMAFRYFDNGVSTDLRIDYGKFALKGTLSQLQPLQVNPCNS